MSGTVARVTEVSALSPTSFDEAIKTGIQRANETLRNVTGAWVKEMKVDVDSQGAVSGYQVHLLITFILD
ncbi:dodecin family protein [Longispora albida]|uniref:dodecin family protein n=1 Tax=Longispora albida TaxID=203523 RepID=UPI00035F1E92|nr:dodecin family protein [Longispora albida]